MDQGFINSRRLIFISALKSGDNRVAIEVLKELIEADLEINFKVETEEEIREREESIHRTWSAINNFRLLFGDNQFD